MQVTRMLSNVFTPVKSIAKVVCNTVSSAVNKASLPRPLEEDTFQRQAMMNMDPVQAQKIFNPDLYKEEMDILITLPGRELSKDIFDSLSPKQLKQFTEYVSKKTMPSFSEQLNKNAKSVALYGDAFQKGLKALVPDGNIKVISVGQSPAMIAEYLSLKGMDTAICPISSLKYIDDEQIAKISKKDTYFKFLKNFGLDLDNIDKTKTYVFTDYGITGTSLQRFREIIEPRLPKDTKAIFVTMQDVIKAAEPQMSNSEKMAVRDFSTEYLCNPELKRFYSPIFHLPALGIGHIESIYNAQKNKQGNVNCNKLKVLLYDLLQKKGQSK